MGVTRGYSTLDGGLTPICDLCGIALCWDISQEEYEEAEQFWDEWCCKHCDPNYRKRKHELQERGLGEGHP